MSVQAVGVAGHPEFPQGTALGRVCVPLRVSRPFEPTGRSRAVDRWTFFRSRQSGSDSVTSVQKSVFVPSRGSASLSTRSGQSLAVMSQKRHSGLLGTRAGGLSADSQRCGLAAEFKSVLGLDVDVEAANFPVGDAFVQERGVVQNPLGLVELGRGSGPALVMGLEPDGPFARVLASQQLGQPGGPDVGRLSGNGARRGSRDGAVPEFIDAFFGRTSGWLSSIFRRWLLRVRACPPAEGLKPVRR